MRSVRSLAKNLRERSILVPAECQCCLTDRHRATYAIQPDRDLIPSLLVLARKEPEVQLARLVARAADWHQPSVALADVKGDFWNCTRGTIHNVF